MSRNRPGRERTLRIIGGNWRSRKVSFADLAEIRPTPDRVRETLFNWLRFDINGARCIEPYAGSGILSLEALSRGARFATMIERDDAACRHLHDNLQSLAAPEGTFEVIRAAAEHWLVTGASVDQKWDIAFLDPPFGTDALTHLLPILDTKMTEDALIYIESGTPLDVQILPQRFGLYRQKKAGQVHYALCRSGL